MEALHYKFVYQFFVTISDCKYLLNGFGQILWNNMHVFWGICEKRGRTREQRLQSFNTVSYSGIINIWVSIYTCLAPYVSGTYTAFAEAPCQNPSALFHIDSILRACVLKASVEFTSGKLSSFISWKPMALR